MPNFNSNFQQKDTIPGISDSLVVNANGIETTIRYFAKDSIITRITNNSTYLYGEARIEYGDIKLNAAEIVIDQSKQELIAKGTLDSLGNWIGRPVLLMQWKIRNRRNQIQLYYSKSQNKGVATQQPDGILRGETVKKNPDQSAYIENGKFIPCLDNPNATTYIKAKKIKINSQECNHWPFFLLYVGEFQHL